MSGKAFCVCVMAFGLETALLAGEAPSSPGFQRVYQAGTRDPEGRFMGGTELVTLASHGGNLWASTGYYWDQPGDDPSPGAQVLTLDRPSGSWLVDREFEPKQWRASLDAITFTTDGQGRYWLRWLPAAGDRPPQCRNAGRWQNRQPAPVRALRVFAHGPVRHCESQAAQDL